MIIAEIGLSHEGSLGTAHSYIDALAKTEVDTIKFQTHVAEAESSENENFRVAFSKQDPNFITQKNIDFPKNNHLFIIKRWYHFYCTIVLHIRNSSSIWNYLSDIYPRKFNYL